MITDKALDVFIKYKGDGDGFARGGKKAEQAAVGGEWGTIDRLLLDLYLVTHNLAAPELIESTEKALQAACATPEVAERLKAYARKQ